MLIVVKKETKIPVKDNLGEKTPHPTKAGKFLHEVVDQDESVDVWDIDKIRPYTEEHVKNEDTEFCMVSFKKRTHEIKVKENFTALTERVNKLRSGRHEK